MSISPTGVSLSLTFDLGPRHFRVWSDPLYRTALTIQELEPGTPPLQLEFQRAWTGFDPELIVKRALYVIAQGDRGRQAAAESNEHPIHYLPARQAAGHRDDCPTCGGFAAAFRREHGHSCPGCGGTGVATTITKPPKRAASKHTVSLADIGL